MVNYFYELSPPPSKPVYFFKLKNGMKIYINKSHKKLQKSSDGPSVGAAAHPKFLKF